MFDHMGIVVTDLSRARRFYQACLAPLDIRCLQDNSGDQPDDGWLVFGTQPDAPFFVVAAGRPSFWDSTSAQAGKSPVHIAFSAATREAVDGFYQAGLDHGGRNNGAPGERASTTPYYAAYLIDPDGNNVEAGVRSEPD